MWEVKSMSEEDMFTGSVQEVGSFEERLRQVASEIDSIKNSFTKGTEDLSRIKNMLDFDAFKNITTAIQKFEGQLSEIERQREEAFQGAKKYSAELEKEKERLIKLWDAYKKQEEELSKTEARIQEFEERARTAETAKEQLEQDYTSRISTLQQKIEAMENDTGRLEEYQKQMNEYAQLNESLTQENRKIQMDLQTYKTNIDQLQQQIGKYKDYEQYVQYKDKYNDVNQSYEKEKERLTKLYHLYEETEHECKRLKQENEQWQNWFNSNKDIFDRLFSAAPPATPKTLFQPKQQTTPQPSSDTHVQQPVTQTNQTQNKTAVSPAQSPQPPEKKKKKLTIFRK
jgi:chromosome segregation ATPase